MGKITALEPAPTQFYAPSGLFCEADLSRMGAVCLGELILSPGCCFEYRVATGPLCRLYWGNGKPEPYGSESAYRQDDRSRWKRSHGNYLSYQLVNGNFLTVRWKSPVSTSQKSEIRGHLTSDRSSQISA